MPQKNVLKTIIVIAIILAGAALAYVRYERSQHEQSRIEQDTRLIKQMLSEQKKTE